MKRERGFMNPELFQQIIKDLKPYLWNLNLYFQGEPMLHRAFFDFVKESSGLHATVSTNGHFLTAEKSERLAQSGLNKLIISLDGIDQETYSKYRRNGDIEIVKEGIRNVSDAVKKFRSKVNVEIQMLVNRYNESQVEEMKTFVMDSGARLVLKSMQIYDESSYSEWMPANKKYRRYMEGNGTYKVKSSLPRRCARLWFNPVITWDGKVLPCCFDKDADHVMGDLREESFREIWHGSKFRQFRNDVLHGREKIPICRNCTSGLKGVKL
jgi:radical SAM protein with 4Fe4S-binding SPASM domain